MPPSEIGPSAADLHGAAQQLSAPHAARHEVTLTPNEERTAAMLRLGQEPQQPIFAEAKPRKLIAQYAVGVPDAVLDASMSAMLRYQAATVEYERAQPRGLAEVERAAAPLRAAADHATAANRIFEHHSGQFAVSWERALANAAFDKETPPMSETEILNFIVALRTWRPDNGSTLTVAGVVRSLIESIENRPDIPMHVFNPATWLAVDACAPIEAMQCNAGLFPRICEPMNSLPHLECLCVGTEPGFDTNCTVDAFQFRQLPGGPPRHIEFHFTRPADGNPDQPFVVMSHKDMPVFFTGDHVDGLHYKLNGDGTIADIVTLERKPQPDAAALVNERSG